MNLAWSSSVPLTDSSAAYKAEVMLTARFLVDRVERNGGRPVPSPGQQLQYFQVSGAQLSAPTIIDNHARRLELRSDLLEQARHGFTLGQIDRKVFKRLGRLFRRPRGESYLVACMLEVVSDRLAVIFRLQLRV